MNRCGSNAKNAKLFDAGGWGVAGSQQGGERGVGDDGIEGLHRGF